MEPLRKKGKTIHSEAREIIRKVISECDEECKNKELKYPVKQVNKRICNYTGVSERSISRIRKESINAGDSRLSTPGKHRPRQQSRNVACDSFDTSVIRNVIYNFYTVEKIYPTCKKLLPAVREKINFPWGVRSLNRIIKRMGFRWRKCQNRRKILIERPHIVDWRYSYLRMIRQYRNESRSIIYIDESWVDANLTFRKCWQSQDLPGVITNTSANNRLIVISAGSEDGFVEGALLIFKAGSVKGDYHGQMNFVNFQKWVGEKLLCLPPNFDVGGNLYVPVSNIPANSVIIMDNAPYHSLQVNKTPSKYAVKSQMIEWLQKQNIQCSLEMRKCELYHLIELHKPIEKIYRIDKLFQSYGHTVLRLPPYMCELNAIELAWAKVKNTVRENNITGDLSLSKLQLATQEAINGVTKEDWIGYCSHVQKVENEFWEKDRVLENAVDSLVVSLESDSTDSNTSDDSSSSETESDLAEPLSD
jgi:hypothetical protein